MKFKKLLLMSIILSSLIYSGDDITPVESKIIEIEPSSKWSFELEPYLMVTSITGDSSLGRVTGAEVNINFDDILEVLKVGAMGHFEAHHQSGWGIWIDYAFMDLSQDTDAPLGGIVTTDVRQGILEAFALYRQPLSIGRIDYMMGIRWWENDFAITVNPTMLTGSSTIDTKKEWVDIVIGANYAYPISENWIVKIRGDVGGFDMESKFTAVVTLGVEYYINDLLSLDLSYKGAWVDYEEGTAGTVNHFAYDTVTYGTIVGLKFKF